jgi:L-2,4-diaminobutyrate decarboxylase
VLPTTHDGETVARLALVNPRTTLADIRFVLDAMI